MGQTGLQETVLLQEVKVKRASAASQGIAGLSGALNIRRKFRNEVQIILELMD